MSEFRGPELPDVGAIYQATTKSGRLWRVQYRLQSWMHPDHEGDWLLSPLGPDVRMWCNEDGELQGGVRDIRRTEEQLRDPKKWRHVGWADNARPKFPVMDREEIVAALELTGLVVGHYDTDEEEGWLPLYEPRDQVELEYFLGDVMRNLNLSAHGIQAGFIVFPAAVGNAVDRDRRERAA